jgi:GntR family transcriptional repressor for pyruvate dehydrogenase complex
MPSTIDESGGTPKWTFPSDTEIAIADRRVPDALAARLQQLIDERTISPGERLPPERELASMFGVSRASMREALNQLVLKGLIDRRPGRGTIVLNREPSDQSRSLQALRGLGANLSDAWDFRAVIEPAIAAQAASRATRADLIRLEEILRFMDRDEALPTFASLDRQFHELIARSCHNPLLASLSDLAFEWIDATRDKSFQTKQRWKVSRKGHREIFAALSMGDPDAAEQAMSKHLKDVASLQREKLKQ